MGLRVLSAEPSAEPYAFGGRDDGDGDDSPPCLLVLKGGRFRFRFPVAAGNRSLSVRAKETSGLVARPQLVVRANAAVGIATDLVTTAPAGTGWVALGPLEFVASAKGAIVVELVSHGVAHEGECRWDHFALA